jgi:hypothetical protein
MKYIKLFENFKLEIEDTISDNQNNKFRITIKAINGMIDIFLYKKDRKIGNIELTSESNQPNDYIIVDSRINKTYRGKGLYKNTLIKILNEIPIIKIYSILRTGSAENAWDSFKDKLPINIKCDMIDINNTSFSDSAFELYYSSPKNLYDIPKYAYVLYKK